jgi:hypothetical protein
MLLPRNIRHKRNIADGRRNCNSPDIAADSACGSPGAPRRAGFASFADVDSVSSVNLLLALSDLKLVHSITSAINANLPKTGPLGTIPVSALHGSPQPHAKLRGSDNVRIEPRQVIHPTPRIEPRQVIHPAPRVIEPPPELLDPIEPEWVNRSKSPLLPPWKTMPPVQPVVVVIEPKVLRQQVDVIHKGTLLDLFV